MGGRQAGGEWWWLVRLMPQYVGQDSGGAEGIEAKAAIEWSCLGHDLGAFVE